MDFFPEWFGDALKPLGSVAAFVGLIVYYVPRDFLPRFVRSQEAQASALTSLAENVKNLPQKDHMRFDEILIGQEMLNRSLDRVHARLDDLKRQSDGAS